MTVSDLEKILWGSLDINDGISFDLESLIFKPAEKRPEWADNPDADGAALVQEAHYTNAYFEGQIRVVPVNDTDTALEALGELMDALQSMEGAVGGLPIPWTPNGSTRTYTWYALLGEISELPTVVDGELAGWFLNSPVLKFKLTCRPFGYRDERVVLAATSSSEPLQCVYIEGIEGDVPAEGTLRITDKAAQDRRYMEWGQDLVESAEGNPDLELEADKDLVVEGYAGELAKHEGSISSEVVKVTLSPTAVVLCSTGPIAHVGSFRCKLRAQADGEGARFHVSYRVGEGNWVTSLPWVEPGQHDQWFDQDQGEIFLEEAEQGEQVSEIRIEGKVEEEAENATGYVDTLYFMPTRRYGVARAPLELDVPTNLRVGDSFNQSEGNATGKTADIGGVYAAIANSDTTDFTVAGGKLKRTAVSDTGTIGSASSFKGRGIGTAKEFTDIAMRTDFTLTGSNLYDARVGHVVSYVDNTHFVVALLVLFQEEGYWGVGMFIANGEYYGFGGLRVPGISPTSPATGTLLTYVQGTALSIYAGSSWKTLSKVFSVNNPNVGVKGKAFLYDEQSAVFPVTREYDNLAIWEPDQPIVCATGHSLDIRAEEEERENSAGTFWSPVHYRGAHFLLDPAGSSDLVNRLAVKMRRNDTSEEPDTNLTDSQDLEVLVSERFLAPR